MTRGPKPKGTTPPPTKQCSRCGLVKHLTDFPRRSDRPCGRKSICLVCDRLKARTYYATVRGPREREQTATRASRQAL